MRKVDRYAIYRMIGKKVKFSNHGDNVIGVVGNVYRDPFKQTVEIGIGDDVYEFREPTSVVYCDFGEYEEISFVFGHDDTFTDEDFYDMLSNVSLEGKGVDDVFREISDHSTYVTFTFREVPYRLKK